ncbi:DUF2190 family protein [Cupriavidus numazuensis]|uniref:DUF2190 domain-containing protein n=1 Tax=Cupriavidus numazuensis TaxID=221992 RepID=A0ABM8T9Y4_9BURK|nr:DUF2190 family protein [Cupriavidus numazuensis]CAG2129165.1 hypothetical protein LMG26411_00129 [Cupriavidus numazuensis]
MSNPILIKTHSAEGALAKNRIVAQGANDGGVKQAAAATDALLGATEGFAYADGDRVGVVRAGIADIEYGGNVTRGQPLTADASGRAVAAAPAGGANVRLIGFAEVSGVSGDICPVFLAPGLMQG